MISISPTQDVSGLCEGGKVGMKSGMRKVYESFGQAIQQKQFTAKYFAIQEYPAAQEDLDFLQSNASSISSTDLAYIRSQSVELLPSIEAPITQAGVCFL